MKLVPDDGLGVVFAFARIALAVYLAVLALLLFFQDRLIFMPEKLPDDFALEFESESVEKYVEVDGLKIQTLFFSAARPRGTILYFHGNAGSLADWGIVAADLSKKTKMNVFIFDYPGYGKSEGAIASEAQLHRIASALYDSVRESVGPQRLILYGRSIGSGLAVKLASEKAVAGLILESPYLSLISLARERFPWAPVFLLKYTFRSDQWMPEVKVPTLLVHGSDDEVIPFAQSERLAGLNSRARVERIAAGRHNDLADFPQYWAGLDRFLDNVTPQSAMEP